MSEKMLESKKVFSPLRKDSEAVLRDKISREIIVDKYRKLGIEIENFLANVENVEIYECQLTKYRFYYPFSISGDDTFYEELQKVKGNYYPPEKNEFEITLGKLEKGAKVLEVGCGDGSFLEQMKGQGIDAVGLEFNELALRKCLSKGLRVSKEPLESFAPKNSEQFDAVVLFQVLEHITEVAPFIENLLTCLKKGGKLIFAVPDNSPYHKNFRIYLTLNLPPHHMGLWNAESFKNLEKVFEISLISVEYDDDYSSFPNYCYFCGDLILSRFAKIYRNNLLRNLGIVLLLPYTIPKVWQMKLAGELKPHSIIATFRKN